jgi:PAS domain S-box-containing protein
MERWGLPLAQHASTFPWGDGRDDGRPYRKLVERVPAVVYVDASDEVSSALYMSPRAEEMLGYSPEKWLSEPELWVRLLHPDDRERVLAEQKRTRETGEPFSAEYRLVAKGGRDVWVRDEAVLVEEDGQPPVWYGLLADVTGRKKTEEELGREKDLFRLTFEDAPSGLAHVAADGRWVIVNRRLCEISGYTRGELSSLTYLDLTLPEDLEDSLERAGRLLRGETGPYTVERRYVRKDGRRIWVRLKVSLAHGLPGEPGYFVCSAEDITERKLENLITEPLTPRELDVLKLIARWQTDAQIAERLSYSLGTIKRDVRNILVKLRVKTRREAALRSVDIGLIRPLQ